MCFITERVESGAALRRGFKTLDTISLMITHTLMLKVPILNFVFEIIFEMESHKLNGPGDFSLKKCIIANLIFFPHKQQTSLYFPL